MNTTDTDLPDISTEDEDPYAEEAAQYEAARDEYRRDTTEKNATHAEAAALAWRDLADGLDGIARRLPRMPLPVMRDPDDEEMDHLRHAVGCEHIDPGRLEAKVRRVRASVDAVSAAYFRAARHFEGLRAQDTEEG